MSSISTDRLNCVNCCEKTWVSSMPSLSPISEHVPQLVGVCCSGDCCCEWKFVVVGVLPAGVTGGISLKCVGCILTGRSVEAEHGVGSNERLREACGFEVSKRGQSRSANSFPSVFGSQCHRRGCSKNSVFIMNDITSEEC